MLLRQDRNQPKLLLLLFVLEQPPEQKQQNTQSYSDVAASAEKSTQERGRITETGEFLNDALDYISEGGYINDAGNLTVAGLNQISGGRLQGLDDAIKSYGEIEDVKQQVLQDASDRLNDGEAQLGDRAMIGLEGVSGGQKSSFLTPVTVATRSPTKTTEFAEPPAVVKGHWEGQLAFEISRLLTTSVLAQLLLVLSVE